MKKKKKESAEAKQSRREIQALNPYPGLRPYSERDASWFFGRSEETRELLDRLTYHRFISVVGSSGCGKSSLIYASLIPALRSGYDASGEAGWKIATMRPGRDPLLNLSAALAQVLKPTGVQDQEMQKRIRESLEGGSLGIVRAMSNAKLAKGTKLLILVDQFEELFTLARNNPDLPSGEIRDFIELLLDSAWTSGGDLPKTSDFEIYVVITMRSENLGLCSRFGDLARAINDGLFLVPQLSSDRLRDVIEFPVDGSIDPALVTKLINDLEGTRDDLPLLQHALMRMWESRMNRGGDAPISLEDLDCVGNVGETIGLQINSEILDALSETDRELVLKAFLEITEVGEDGQMNRVPKTFRELVNNLGCGEKRLRKIIDSFRKEGCCFLRPFMEDECRVIDDNDVIDISHESLIRQWEELFNRASELKRLRAEVDLISKTADDWVIHGKQERDLEHSERKNSRGLELLEELPMRFTNSAKLFVEASREKREKTAREERELKRKKKRDFKIVITSVAVSIVGIIVIVLVSQLKAQTAQAKMAEAQAEAAKAATIAAKAEANAAKAAATAAKAQVAEAVAQTEKAAALAEAALSEKQKQEAITKAAAAESERQKQAAESERLREVAEEEQRKRELELDKARLAALVANNRESDTKATLAMMAYRSLVGMRGYADANRQLESFPKESIDYLGTPTTRGELEKIVAFEARRWPQRAFSFVVAPDSNIVEVEGDQQAEVTGILLYEYRDREAFGETPPKAGTVAAGFIRETTRFRFSDELVPVLLSVRREKLDSNEVRELLSGEYENLLVDVVPGYGEREDIAKVLYWLNAIDQTREQGGIVTSPNLISAASGALEVSGLVYRAPEADRNQLSWFEIKFTVPNTGRIQAADQEMIIMGKGIMPEFGSQPWPSSFEAIQEDELNPTREEELYTIVEDWVKGIRARDRKEVAEACGQLYILCGNPNPPREQIEFFSEEHSPRSYYGPRDPTLQSIEKDLSGYKEKYPQRNFELREGVVIASDAEVSNPKEIVVNVPFVLKHDQSADSMKLTTMITFLIQLDEWPIITSIDSRIDKEAPEETEPVP